MKVSILGNGFVADHLPYHRITERLDFSSKQIENLLETEKPDVVVNCIGKCGNPNVDWCEANKEITALTNTALPIMLATVCAKKSIHMIQIGSGCIFFNKSPNTTLNGQVEVDLGWKEINFPNPQSYYSKTKAACDFTIGEMKNVTTLRIRMPISSKNHPRNLINKLRGYKQVIDAPNSITMMSDLMRCIDWAITTGQVGIFHVTNPQPITAAQIMKMYQTYKPEHTFEAISEGQLDKLTIAKRSNCLLNTEKLQKAGFHMTPSEEALKQCMNEYVKNLKD